MTSLVINPGRDFFSQSPQSNQHTKPFNPFAFRPSKQLASNVAPLVDQQSSLSKKDSKSSPKGQEGPKKSHETQRVRTSTSPEKRRISTKSKSSKLQDDAKMLAFFELGHLRGRVRRRMVKRCKRKLRSMQQAAPLSDNLIDLFERKVLKHTSTPEDSSIPVDKKREILKQQIESYINETDSSSHSSDDNSSEQASRGPSPMQDAGTTKVREDGATDKIPQTSIVKENKKEERKDEEKEKKEKKDKKRKAVDDSEEKELSKKERKALKKAKKAATAKDGSEHKFAEPEETPGRRQAKEVAPSTFAKKVSAEEVKPESPMAKPKGGRINIRSKIPKNQMPKSFQALYDGIPDNFKMSKAWKEFPRSILSGKTAGSGNISNYCYFNTAMQMLSHIAPLVQYLVYYHSQKQCPIERKDKVCVCCEIREFILRSYEDQRDGFYILKRLGLVLEKRFRTTGRYHEQQDSNDAMLSILEKAIAQLKTQQDDAKKATPIEEILSFKNRSTITCKSCHYKSVEETDTLLHIMDIPQGRNELQLMEAYKSSITDTISGYKCSKCKKSVEITKRTEIATLPPYLLILATRNVVFTMPSFGRRGGKKGRRGEVESDPRRVVVPPTHPTTFATSEGRKETYALSGVAIHQGSSHHGGHWIHLGKLPNGEWATHSDRHVSTSPQLHFPRRGSIGVVFGFSRS